MGHTQPTIAAPYSSDTQIRLTEYRTDFELALEAETLPELVGMGHQLTSSALKEEWEINSGDIAFEELVADIPNLVRFGAVKLNLTTKKYGGGVVQDADTLRAIEWLRRGWGTGPQKAARAWMRLMEECVAAALEAGGSTASFEQSGKYIFDTSKATDPADPGNGHTYSNLHTGTALSVANIKAMRTSFRTQKGPIGKPRGYRLTHILVGPDKEDELLTYLKEDMIAQVSGAGATATTTMVRNTLKQYAPITPIVCDYLDDSGVWYPIASEEIGPAMPWLTLIKLFANSGAAPGMPAPNLQSSEGLEWLEINEMSDAYREGGKMTNAGEVAMWAKGRVGCAIVSPWRIKRCEP